MGLKHINLQTQIAQWTANTSIDATGTMTAVKCAEGVPVWNVKDQFVTAPNIFTQAFTNGMATDGYQFDLPKTSGKEYWKFTITIGKVSRTWYFTWLDTAHTDFEDLTFIDPRTYAGV